jgi:hypothetical protein
MKPVLSMIELKNCPKKDKQYNGQRKKNKWTFNGLQNLKFEPHEPTITGVYSCALEGLVVPTPSITPVVILLNNL